MQNSPRPGPRTLLRRTAALLSLLACVLCAMPVRAQQAPAVTVVHDFASDDAGSAHPLELLLASDGIFYGTAIHGRTDHYYTIFQLLPDGTERTLHTFPTGIYLSPLVEGRNGGFYGVATPYGGKRADFFRVTSAGAYRVLYHAENILTPEGRLVVGVDGNFYGATLNSIYRLTPRGVFTQIYQATDAAGAYSLTGLMQGAGGFLYCTSSGGLTGFGTVFRLNADGSGFKVLHGFSNTDGSNPSPNLAQTPDGTLYGTTYSGGVDNLGTLFSVRPDGAHFRTRHEFRATDGNPYNGRYGNNPESGLILASDGNLYGTTYGNTDTVGTIFKLTPAGEFTSITPVAARSNTIVEAPLVQATDGTFYGAAQGVTYSGSGNPAGVDIAFRCDLGLPPAARVPLVVLKALTPTATVAPPSAHPGVFAIYFTEATSADLTVHYKLGGTARNGVDYEALSGVLTIPAGNTFALVEVVPTANLETAGSPSVELTLTPGAGYTIRTTKPRTVIETDH